MGDANKNVNNNRILEAFQRSGKRVRDDENEERRQRPRHQEDGTGEYSGETSEDTTPRASNSDLSNNNLLTTDTENEVSDIESQITLPTIRVNNRSRDISSETVVDTESRNDTKLKLAFKIDNLRNKTERYDSHATFLKKCLDNNIIPNGLKC